MLKFFSIPPLIYLTPSTDKPNVSVALHAILALHFHRYIFNFSQPNLDLITFSVGAIFMVLIVCSGLFSIKYLPKNKTTDHSCDDKSNEVQSLKFNRSLKFQICLTLMMFFTLVFKALV